MHKKLVPMSPHPIVATTPETLPVRLPDIIAMDVERMRGPSAMA